MSFIQTHGDGTATCPDCNNRVQWKHSTWEFANHNIPGTKKQCLGWNSPRAKRCQERECKSWNTRHSGKLVVLRNAICEWMECLDCGHRYPHVLHGSYDTIRNAKEIAQRMYDKGANGRQINERMRSILGIPVTYGMTNSWFRRDYGRRHDANPLTDKLNAIHRRVAVKGSDSDLDALEKEIEAMMKELDRDLAATEKRTALRQGAT